YDLVEEVGRGAYGVVYRGRDPFVQRDVAIKIALGVAAEKADDVFFAEARAAGKMNHPYIASLYDAAKEEGQRYIVMEFIQGETLKRFCDPDGPRLKVERIVDIMLKVSLALDYVHKNGVLHKDIKPANIMLTVDGTPKLMDFGIAAESRAVAAERQTQVEGSPMFMSPEQCRGLPLSPASDLYALGALMYILLAGKAMFIASTPKELFLLVKTAPAPSLKGVKGIPPELAHIVDKLLAKDPAARYQTGRELGEELAAVAEGLRTGGRRKSLVISDKTLKELRFFKAFTSGELKELLDASTTVVSRAGQVIIKEGEMDNCLYILLAGLAEVRKGRQLIALLEKGDVFGEIGFLYAVKRTASVMATTDVMALKVNSTLLEQMSEQCQLHYYKVFTENLILRLALTTDKAATLLPKSDLALDFILP
ncbi:MAG: protein kinase domain-containing protein, partial [Gammaproteobacteria bacterium]